MTLENKIMEYISYVGAIAKRADRLDFKVSRLGVIDILSKDADVLRMGWTPQDINDVLREMVVTKQLVVVGDKQLMTDPLGNQLYTIDRDGIQKHYTDNLLTIGTSKK